MQPSLPCFVFSKIQPKYKELDLTFLNSILSVCIGQHFRFEG